MPPLVALVLQLSLWPEAGAYRWGLTLTGWLGGAWLGVAVAGLLLGDRGSAPSWRERKTRRIRQALAQSNAELKRAQAVANIGSWRFDPVTDRLYWSDETYRLFEVPHETVIDQSEFLRRVAPEDFERVKRAWTGALQGERFDLDHRIVTPSGVKWVRQRAVLDFATDGTLLGGMGTVQDVTAAKTVENALRESEARVRLVLDSTGDGIFGLDVHGRCMFINRAALRLLGYENADALIGVRLHAVIQPYRSDHGAISLPHCTIYRVGTEGRSFHVEHERFRRADGSWFDVEYHAAPIIRDGERMGIVVSFDDITERKRTEALLRRAAIVFESTREGIFVTDAQRRILTVNPAFTDISGYSLDEVRGRAPDFQRSERHDDAFYQRLWAAVEQTGQWQGELTHRRKNGEVYPVWGNVSAVRNEEGEVTNYVALLADISELKEAEQQLRYLAHHDALTELPNRLLFQAHLTGALERAKRHGYRVALLFLDLDRFKLINDSLGHGAGDDLLIEISRRLREMVRAEDLVARLGGDEFTVTMESVRHPDDAAHLATKLIDVLMRPVRAGGRRVVISGSIGISLFPDDANNVEELVKTADAAMYRAKDRGRNGFEFHTPEISARTREHLALESGLRAALDERRFELYFQPQIDVVTRRLVGAEALLRWHHPDDGVILPGRFISIAEESDLIEQIGDWVIGEACAQVRRWRDGGLPTIRIGVNVAGRQMQHDVDSVLAAALSANGLQSDDIALEVEITETVLQFIEHGARKLEGLRKRGVRIAIDDFGTGYSSLSRLQHLPLDTLKIDQAFIRGLPDDASNRAITRAVIAMGRSLGLRVLAEGVETERQFAFLRDEGCDEVQGFLFGKPVPAADLELRLRAD